MHQDDEIDLLELFSDLWNGKWYILSATIFAVLIGGSYAAYKEKNQAVTHQSTISFTRGHLPPFLNANDANDANDANEIFSDFKELFHSKVEFDTWKSDHSQSQIEYDDLSLTQIVDGIELASQNKLISLTPNELVVETNNLQLLDSYRSYLQAINQALTNKYIDRAEKEKTYIETRFKDFWNSDDSLNEQILIFMSHTVEVRALDRYIEVAKSGVHVFDISRPTLPVVTSPAPKTNLILGLSFLLGGFFGAAYVLLRNAIRRRRDALKEA